MRRDHRSRKRKSVTQTHRDDRRGLQPAPAVIASLAVSTAAQSCRRVWRWRRCRLLSHSWKSSPLILKNGGEDGETHERGTGRFLPRPFSPLCRDWPGADDQTLHWDWRGGGLVGIHRCLERGPRPRRPWLRRRLCLTSKSAHSASDSVSNKQVGRRKRQHK